MIDSKHDDYIYDEAAHWLELLSRDPRDHVTRKRFANWLQENPKHRAIFESMLSTWEDPGLHRVLNEARRRSRKARFGYAFFSLPVLGSVAATAVLVLLVLTVSFEYPLGPSETVPRQYAADTRSPLEIYLEDGTVVDVAPSSKIQIDIDEALRSVELLEGASYFAVAKDKTRPFVVSLGSASVTAVGTEFDIDRGPIASDVTVYEGAVEVRIKGSTTVKLLKAGERVRIENGVLSDIVPVQLDSLVDWRSGWLEVQGESLQYLVERLNRRRDIKIHIMDDALMSLPVAGRFRLDDSEQSLAMLAEIYALELRQRGDSVELRKP